ncbi:MAG: Coenzyme F420 hydrogenase/dehydrogenase, beta subunit C-terminal domain [Bacillota bacterium]
MEELRRVIREMLAGGKVDLVIAYAKGSLPLRSTPVFIRNAEDAECAVFDATCENNLSTYLPRYAGKRLAVVAKGCDARSVQEYLRERQLDPGNVVVIGVPCQGVIGRDRLSRRLSGKEITGAEMDGDTVRVRGDGWEETLQLFEVLHPSCETCEVKEAPGAAIKLGEAAAAQVAEPFALVDDMERLTPDERWAYFTAQFEKCIRCYACRQACPGCYCKECFVDRSAPRWVGGTDDPSDTAIFHIIRALHLAGRCVDCGACVKACPMGVDLRALNKKLERDVRELFGFTAGLEHEGKQVLSTFRADDPNDFIK